jgi:hypothetical protein
VSEKEKGIRRENIRAKNSKHRMKINSACCFDLVGTYELFNKTSMSIS